MMSQTIVRSSLHIYQMTNSVPNKTAMFI